MGAAVLSFLAVFLRAAILGLPLSATLSLSTLVSALAALSLGGFTDLAAIGTTAVALGLVEQGVNWNEPNRPTLVYAIFAVIVMVGLLLRRRAAGRVDHEQDSALPARGVVRPMPRPLGHTAEVAAVKWVGLLVVTLLAVMLPSWLGPSEQLKAATVVILAIVTLSVVVLTGWTGQISLGQMSFVAVGAALGAVATSQWGLDLSLALLFAGLCAALTAVVVGLPALRLGGLFLAVTTLAFALATSGYLLNRSQFSWLPRGRIERPQLFGAINLASQRSMYELSLACLVLALVAVRGMHVNRSGRAMRAVRDNELVAQAFGVRAMRSKLIAFAVSGFLAAVARCLLVHLNQQYTELPFQASESLGVFTAAVVGGLGSSLGALLGSLFLNGGRWFLPTNWQLLPSAAGVLVVLLVLPGGLAEVVFWVRDRSLQWLIRRRRLLVPALAPEGPPVLSEAL